MSNERECGEVTLLLRRINAGDAAAEAALTECVYTELKRLAAHFLNKERREHTLQATALVHEAFLRLLGEGKINFSDRNHFFAVAANIMRRLLIDYGRRQRSKKRGGGGKPLPLDEQVIVAPDELTDLMELGEALNKLERTEPRQAKIVEMRYFGGMSEEEIAAHLNISTRTVKRDWALARAMLYGELKRAVDPSGSTARINPVA
jgi:RNA polymerase sigma-70 factor (ECF subfamily)